jgi:hypothetical protein
MLSGFTPYPQYSSSAKIESGFYQKPDRAVADQDNVTESKNGAISRAQDHSKEDSTRPNGSPRDEVKLSQEAQEIRELQLRDREVRAHEAAHAAAGGTYAGSPSYTFERGPDGHSYAVGGSVSIDTSPVKGDPRATLQKAEQVRVAALAPAQPSAQDMKIAQKAQAMAAKARVEMVQQRQSSLSHRVTPDDSFPVASFGGQKELVPNSQDISVADASSSVTGLSRLDIYS